MKARHWRILMLGLAMLQTHIQMRESTDPKEFTNRVSYIVGNAKLDVSLDDLRDVVEELGRIEVDANNT